MTSALPSSPQDQRSAVALKELHVKRGGREVLHSLTFSVARGTVTGLLGPSGCGKTTLLRSIAGVQIIHSGSIPVLGKPAGNIALRRLVGYATQSAAVYRDLTVVENLRYFCRVISAPLSDVDRVLEDTGLTPHANQLASSLSGGELSRSSLAVALLGSPQLLLMDEPTADLDPVLRDNLWQLFHRLASGGVTLFVSSHVMDEASRCQRLLLMRDGNILLDDTPEALCKRTNADDLEQAFLRLIQAQQAKS